MQYLSLIGVVLGIALFVFASVRGANILLASLLSSSFMFACSGQNILTSLSGVYMPGIANFIKSYFFLFVFSAALGRVLSAGGAAKRIALALMGLTQMSGKHKQLVSVMLLAMIYLLLTYIGITGFVLVFTVFPIGRELFRSANIPWRLYCYGGCATILSGMIAGALQMSNVYAMDVCGTATTAAPILSFVVCVVFMSVLTLLVASELRSAGRRGEGFMETGAAVMEVVVDEGLPVNELPSLWKASLPMACTIVLTAGFRMDIVLTLVIGCVLACLLFRRQIPSLRKVLGEGVTSCYTPVIHVAATYAMSLVVKGTAGFALFTTALGGLPPILEAVGLGMSLSFITASAFSWIPVFGQSILGSYLKAGLNAETAHRMMTISSFTSIPPHSAGVANAAAVIRLPYGKCAKVYLKGSLIPGFAGLFAALLWLYLGLPA